MSNQHTTQALSNLDTLIDQRSALKAQIIELIAAAGLDVLQVSLLEIEKEIKETFPKSGLIPNEAGTFDRQTADDNRLLMVCPTGESVNAELLESMLSATRWREITTRTIDLAKFRAARTLDRIPQDVLDVAVQPKEIAPSLRDAKAEIPADR